MRKALREPENRIGHIPNRFLSDDMGDGAHATVFAVEAIPLRTVVLLHDCI